LSDLLKLNYQRAATQIANAPKKGKQGKKASQPNENQDELFR
jgi:hypothetical protein